MDCTLSSWITQSQNRQIQYIIVDNSNQKIKQSNFQIHFKELLKFQKFQDKWKESNIIKQICLKRQNKSPQIRKTFKKEQSAKQLLTMPQQLHQKFIQQKQKELLKFLSICLIFISLVVIVAEYNNLKKQSNIL